jgi:hypothetical protein
MTVEAGIAAATLRVQCTIEDYAEAFAAHVFEVHRTRHQTVRPTLTWILLAVGLALIALIFIAESRADRVTRMESLHGLAGLALPYLPLGLVLALMLLVPSLSRRAGRHVRLILVIFALSGLAFWCGVASFEYGTILASPPLSSAALAWLIFFIFLYMQYWRLFGGNVVRRAWESQPHLALPRAMKISDAGLSFEDEMQSVSYRWPAFMKTLETANLFLLYISKISFEIVPKRNFADQQQVDQFRQVLKAMTGGGTGAFPVVAAKTSA